MSCPITVVGMQTAFGGPSLLIGFKLDDVDPDHVSNMQLKRVDVTLEQACAECTPRSTPSRVLHDSLLPETRVLLDDCVAASVAVDAALVSTIACEWES
jgi:hypothetical protein